MRHWSPGLVCWRPSVTDDLDRGTTVLTNVVGALAGTASCLAFTAAGMTHLGVVARRRARLLLTSVVLGAVWGLAVTTGVPGRGSWLVAAAFVVWGSGLVAAAACDAVTQRVPTPVVRAAFIATGAALATGLVLQGDLRRLLLTGMGVAAAGLTLLACWRFAGAGFGDVRLAVLGGLGLGHASGGGLLLGLISVLVATAVLAALVVARGGDRKTLVPLGPALAVGFLVAAVA